MGTRITESKAGNTTSIAKLHSDKRTDSGQVESYSELGQVVPHDQYMKGDIEFICK